MRSREKRDVQHSLICKCCSAPVPALEPGDAALCVGNGMQAVSHTHTDTTAGGGGGTNPGTAVRAATTHKHGTAVDRPTRTQGETSTTA